MSTHLSFQRSLFGLAGVLAVVVGVRGADHPKFIGWRTDGSGSYPKALPPTEWTEQKNVIWRTQLPGKGVGHPVILGQRIFIGSEPCTLLCLNRADGKILWQQNSSYAELDIPADVRNRLQNELAATAEWNQKQSAVQKEMDSMRRALTKDNVDRKEIDTKLQPFRKRIEEIEAEKLKLSLAVRYTEPRTHPFAGYSAPTPVTDGKEVFVAFGNGLVACFDLDGKRQWLKLVEHSNLSFAHSSSPILVGDKVVIHFTDLVALDRATGREAWRLKVPAGWGTPLTARIGDVDIILTPKGAMVRASDGTLLADKLGSCGAGSPILHEGVVYWVHGTATAVRLPESVPDSSVKLAALWKARVGGSGYGFCSPVIHQGLVYTADDRGILTVLEAASGKTIYQQRLELGGSIYPSISAAGERIFVSSDNGTTVVLQPGRSYKELARNKLETFRSSLVFDEKRVYIRTEKHLYCIGQ